VRLLVCGSRDWTDGEMIFRELSALPDVEVVIEGEAPGADSLARRAAEQLGIPVLPFPADWEKHGRAAGPLRNQLMLDGGKPDLVLAFSEDLNSSRGTADTVARARRAGIPVRLFSHAGERSL
jgi:hypothetical protein